MRFESFVDETMGVVVVKSPDAFRELYLEIEAFFGKQGFLAYDIMREICKEYENTILSMTGRASCNYLESDEFDESFGYDLAVARYHQKFEYYRAAVYQKILNKLEDMMTIVNKRLNTSLDRYYNVHPEAIESLIESYTQD